MSGTKKYIITTSLNLFLQKSYKEVTLREIVERTGLSKGAFYHYFKGKEDLFKEIVTLLFKMGASDFEKFNTGSLRIFLDQYLAYNEESFMKINLLMGGDEKSEVPFNFFFIMFEAMKRFPEFLTKEKEQYEVELKVWENVIQKAKESGEIKSNSSNRDIADLFLYCTDGVFIRVLNSGNDEKYVVRLKMAFDAIYLNLKQ